LPLDFAWSALVTLFVTVDPIGLAPLFIALTGGMTRAQSRRLAITACLIAFGVLVGFAIGGEFVLRQLGIGLPAFRIAGGLLLFKVSFEMVFAQRTERKEAAAEAAVTAAQIRNLAAFPLAVPLMAGPGAITATLLLADQARSGVAMATLFAIIAAVILACIAVFIAAHEIARFLGDTGRVILTRLLGVILSALAVQFVINGIVPLFAGH
jgi:multiple antibiotic resistance protein